MRSNRTNNIFSDINSITDDPLLQRLNSLGIKVTPQDLINAPFDKITRGFTVLGENSEKLGGYANSLSNIIKAKKALYLMVNNFIPDTFNDELKSAWKKLGFSDTLREVPPLVINSLGPKITSLQTQVMEESHKFHEYNLEKRETFESISMLSQIQDFLKDANSKVENAFAKETLIIAYMSFIQTRKKLLPYFIDTKNEPEIKKTYIKEKIQVNEWFSENKQLSNSVPPLTEAHFEELQKILGNHAAIHNEMLEGQLKWYLDFTKWELEHGDKTEYLTNEISAGKSSYIAGEKSGDSKKETDILASPISTLIGETISLQAKLAHFSLSRSGSEPEPVNASEKEIRLRQDVYDINQTLFEKTERFTAGMLDLFSTPLTSHTNEQAIPRIRSFEKRSGILARQYGGFTTLLERAGLGEYVTVFQKLEERLHDVKKITNDELKKRGAEEKPVKPKKKSRSTIEYKLRPKKEKSEAPTSDATDQAKVEVEDDDFDDTFQGSEAIQSSLTEVETPPSTNDIEIQKSKLKTQLEKSRQSLQETVEELRKPLHEKIREYLEKNTVEPYTKESLNNLEKNMLSVENMEESKRKQALLENYGQGMVDQLVKAEINGISQHYSFTEQAISHLTSLKKIAQDNAEHAEEAEKLSEEVQHMKDQHRSIAREICEDPIYPNEAALRILHDQSAISVQLADEGIAYYWRSNTTRGDRGLFDVYHAQKKVDGTLCAEIHVHYEGNPDTGEAYLTPTGKKRVTSIKIKHPDVAERGRNYERSQRNQGVAKAVHRTNMSEEGLRQVLSPS